MPLHPEIAAALAAMPAPPPGPLDPVAMRAAEEAHLPPAGPEPFAVEDRVTDGGVPVRVYTPSAAERHGTLVYLHGGAFFLGSVNTHDHVARSLAAATGLRVVSADYRLVPEHPHPAGLDDCTAVLRWAAQDPGWDGRTLAVAGDSSGGTYAAAVAARAKDAVTHQVLYYPSLDLDFDTDRWPSRRENATGYGLETAGLKPFNAFFLDGADPADPEVSPLRRADLTGLPPALIVTAEYDPLRDEGEAYGERLRAAGVPVTVSRYRGAGHGFVQHFSHLPEYARVFEQTAAFLAGPAARPAGEDA
ncbi:alpha/beta hydrolase [Kitasatospora sp. NPDC004272]